jgi:tetratricopeptide (TPR) repeat protein
MPRRLATTATLLLLVTASLGRPQAGPVPDARRVVSEGDTLRLSPRYRLGSPLDPVMERVPAGRDDFPTEKHAEELSALLDRLGAWLRDRPIRAHEVMALLAPDFRGTRLGPERERSGGNSRWLEVYRAEAVSSEPALDGARFAEELAAFVSDYETIRTAEFHVTSISEGEGSVVRTLADYDLVGNMPDAGRAEKQGRWRIDWRKEADGTWKAVLWIALDQTRSRAPAPIFVDASRVALGASAAYERQLRPGVDYWRSVLDGAIGLDIFGNNGVAAGDVDGDSLDDFYVCQPAGLPNRLFRNRGDGTFEDVTEAAGVAVLDASSMALFADVDNDGDQDLIVITWRQPLFFLNDGRGRFTPKPDAFRFARPSQGAFTSAALADFDRDGYLDLYVCAYTYLLGEGAYRLATPYHDARNGPPNVLFRNDGKGGFEDVTAATGLENNDRFSFACAWGDYDDDGWPDLLVANDFGRKNLYRNNGRRDGRVTFTDLAGEAGVEDVGAGMSASFFDYDNDGRLDVYTGNMWSAAGLRVTAQASFQRQAPAETLELYRRHARGNSLFRNRGLGTFLDVSLEAGAEMGRWAWSSDALDFDNDGWQDLYVVNGFVTNTDRNDLGSFFWRQVVAQSPLTSTPTGRFEDGWRAINRLIRAQGSWAGRERHVCLRNDGAGHFDQVAGSVGLDFEQDGRAFAVADLDQDGDPDLVVKARTGPQVRVLRNDFREHHAAVAIRLVGTRSNRDAIGAQVTVETDQGRYMRELQAGSGFLSQHSKELLVGIGRSRAIREVVIVWPSGVRESLTGVPLNHRIQVEEGRGAFGATPFRGRAEPPAAVLGTAAVEAEPGPVPSATWLYERHPAPDFTLRDLAGNEHRLSRHRGRPVVLNFWVTSCPPCRQQLESFRQGLGGLRAAGAALLTVAVTEPGGQASVRDLAHASGPGLTVLLADEDDEDEDMVGSYNLLNRYLFDRNEDMPLPTTFLLDSRGEIARIYRGATGMDHLLADLKRLDAAPADPAARLALALPFPGRFYAPLPVRNHFPLGIAFAERGLEVLAIAAFERAVELNPRFAQAHYNLGTLYLSRGDVTAARGAFERALEVQPDYPEVHNNLGLLLASKGDLAEAIAQFEAALRSRPDDPDALNNLGRAHLQAGRRSEALRLLERALEVRPGFPEAQNNLGVLFGNEGDLERAGACFRKALEARPVYAEAASNLAVVYLGQGRGEEAIALLERSLKQEPAVEATYLTLSRMYIEAGKPREAERVLGRLLARSPRNPTALRLLAEVKGAVR